MNEPCAILEPDQPELEALCRWLADLGGALYESGDWPAEQLRLCGQHGVFRWFMEHQWGGQAWNDVDITRGYLRLSAACLTTAFIITQRTGACQRLAGSDNAWVQQQLLPDLVAGDAFATVGISHLTTSRRHLGRGVLQAQSTSSGYLLQGFSPWVTGAVHASTIVTGAELPDGQQILLALPTDLPGVTALPPSRLVGISSSHTGAVRFDDVRVDKKWLLAGPAENVMKLGVGGGTGGLQTSTLAIGLAASAIAFLDQETEKRSELAGPTRELSREHAELEATLLALAGGNAVCSNEQLRARANSIALRATQAALGAAKGSGYVVGHPAGRWCKEALFFLVWSCPQGVLASNLCELAGLDH